MRDWGGEDGVTDQPCRGKGKRKMGSQKGSGHPARNKGGKGPFRRRNIPCLHVESSTESAGKKGEEVTGGIEKEKRKGGLSLPSTDQLLEEKGGAVSYGRKEKS